MPIPPLQPDGLLPPGIHDCTFDELDSVFGVFQGSDRRVTLAQKLRAYLDDARAAEIVAAVVIDGSFVTAKAAPGDVDIVVVLRDGVDFSKPLSPYQERAVSKQRVKERHGIEDVLVAPDEVTLRRHISFFARLKDRDGTKGVLRIVL